MSDQKKVEPSSASKKEEKSQKTNGLAYLKTFLATSTLARKDKNEPARFLGDGVSFKAKLIGILEVSEARGDRMCQEALSDLKMAIRAAGEHKQRININIAIDGLRLRDEKTGDCLYHHPVHKISFIAQDMSDSRAFGYIFGSPDTGHRFFGIKTDKAASQVVITMRDLFQVVFELKKKEIEMAKQHIEHHQKFTSSLFMDSTTKTPTDPLKIRPISEDRKESASAVERTENHEHIMDLLDLELELSNIQQGINQMDRITPSDPFGPSATSKPSSDPFGDSFNPISNKSKLPPPPETGKKAKSSEKHWFDQETEALFEETDLPNSSSNQPNPSAFPLTSISSSPLPEPAPDDGFLKKLDLSPSRDQFDVFTDLDPLGTGRSKPYVDKKDFFQDLKNPPKKVLKDLVTEVPDKQVFSNFEEESQAAKSESGYSFKPFSFQISFDPFQDDPFDQDPFYEVDFSKSIFTPSNGDPFEKFADFASFPEQSDAKFEDSKSTPLKVSLPPEKLGADASPLSKRKGIQKANSLSGIIKPPSPKQKNRKIYQMDGIERKSPEGFKPRNLYSSTEKFSEPSAPEPPPRSALNCFSMKPPPLPPKRVPCSSKPLPRPPHSDYDYIENYQTHDINSPPLPAPARKPKSSGKVDTEYYLQPFPLLPPPKKKIAPKGSDVTNVSTSDIITSSTSTNKSLDITLSQLTKTGFSDLAATLNMSPTTLSKMTLQELTKCLAKLSVYENQKENPAEDRYSLKESSETPFKAEFDAHFDDFSKKGEESLFDKYAVFRELLEEEKKETEKNVKFDHVKNEKEPPAEDRYAALRDICLDDVAEEKYEDLSDKEDSIIEPSKEEDTDLLSQSRPHSGSTESPTLTTKEHQSIMEEDISALNDDDEEESIDKTLKEQIEEPSGEKFAETKPDTWAKFDSAVPAESASSVHSEGHVSPWSTESKENDMSPACRDKRKHRKVRRLKQNQYEEDEESEEGWEGREHGSWSPSWRENGWSDGDSLYDETHGYIDRDYPSPRRGRRMTPWNSRELSPWEEDNRNEDWESSRWQEEVCQRPKHRGQSWEDERRRHYEESRKPRKMYDSWEEEERYQKRNYMRRKKWEEDAHNRNRSWRERDWAEPGKGRYCKERGHDMHWDSEYGEHDDEHWNRPRSCDRTRRQFSSHHSSDSDFSERRFMRSREGHDSEYRRKAHTLQRQKPRRKHSQTSPFEDDFSSQFGFPKESPSGPDAFDPELKKSPSFESHKKSSFERNQYPNQDYHKSSRSYQQSPFEDDFMSPDARRCSGRSASSDMSDPRGDEVFFPSYKKEAVKRPKSASQAESSRKPKNAIDTKIIPERETPDVTIAQTDKKAMTDPKGRLASVKRSDSSSSLRKSESVNIFARNNDPFDDDFFFEEPSTLHRNKR